MRRLSLLLASALAAVAIGGLVTASPAQAMIAPDPAGSPVYGPYPAEATIDGRGSMSSADRVKTNAYLVGAQVYIYCQDSGETVDGSSIWDYTREGYWEPDVYLKTGTSGFVSGVPRCLAIGVDGHGSAGSPHGPYPAEVDIDGRGSADPNDRVRTNAYLVGSDVYIKCQDNGIAVGGSALWDYTTQGYWVPDVYVKTGTTGRVPGIPTCSSLGIPSGVGTNPNGGRQFYIRTTLNGYHGKSLTSTYVNNRYIEGRYITVMCQAYGAVNYGGSAIWDKTSDGLWVADYYVVTGSSGFVMTRCDNDAASGSGSRFLAETTLNGYNGKSLTSTYVNDKYPGGSYITVVCQAYGEFNYGGSAVWDKTSDGLWVADYYVKTGVTDIFMTRCDNDPKPTGGSGNPGTPGTPATGSVASFDIRDKIVNAALSQVGVHEWGDNCNPYGLGGPKCGDPWCAMFASWAWRMAGINVYLPYSGDFQTWGRSHGTIRTQSQVRPGDLVLFGTGYSASNHVGVVAGVEPDGRITTIEGNLSNQVQIVGPYNFADAAAYHPGDGGIYAIVAPQSDSSNVWQYGTQANPSNCTAQHSDHGVTYYGCLEFTNNKTRGVVVVRGTRDTVARVSMTMGSKNGTWSSVVCQAELLRTGDVKICATVAETQYVGAVWLTADLRTGGSDRPMLKIGDTYLHGNPQENSETYCGPATLKAAAWTMGANPVPTQDALAAQVGTGSTGSLPWNMASTMSANTPLGMGYRFYSWTSFGNSSTPLDYGLEVVRLGLDNGQPSILLVKPQFLPWGVPGGNGLVRHYVLIHGYAGAQSNGGDVPYATDTFRVWDPATGDDNTITWQQLITAADSAEVPGDITTISPLTS